MLHPTRAVPPLSVETLDHGPYELGRDHGPNGTLLVFYRGLHCPLCIRQMTEIEAELDQFADLGVEVTMLSADGRERAQQTADKAGVKSVRIGYGLPLKAARDDWKLHLSSARGGTTEPQVFHEPGHFYVDADGTLCFGWVQTSPFGRPTLSDLLGAIRFHVDKGYPPRGTFTGPLPDDS